MTEDGYEHILGKKERFPDLLRFFQHKVDDHGLDTVLANYMPRLVQGAAGALTHGIIHAGWGLDGQSRWMTIEGVLLPPLHCAAESMYMNSLGLIEHIWQLLSRLAACVVCLCIPDAHARPSAGQTLLRGGRGLRCQTQGSNCRPRWQATRPSIVYGFTRIA